MPALVYPCTHVQFAHNPAIIISIHRFPLRWLPSTHDDELITLWCSNKPAAAVICQWSAPALSFWPQGISHWLITWHFDRGLFKEGPRVATVGVPVVKWRTVIETNATVTWTEIVQTGMDDAECLLTVIQPFSSKSSITNDRVSKLVDSTQIRRVRKDKIKNFLLLRWQFVVASCVAQYTCKTRCSHFRLGNERRWGARACV